MFLQINPHRFKKRGDASVQRIKTEAFDWGLVSAGGDYCPASLMADKTHKSTCPIRQCPPASPCCPPDLNSIPGL